MTTCRGKSDRSVRIGVMPEHRRDSLTTNIYTRGMATNFDLFKCHTECVRVLGP